MAGPSPAQTCVGEYLPLSVSVSLATSMTLGGVRSLVDAGLYPQDNLVTDRVFALFLVSLFGNSFPPPLPPLDLVTLPIIFTELLKFFRSASNDPEQRPKNTKKIKYQYDFIIIGKYLTIPCRYYNSITMNVCCAVWVVVKCEGY